MKRLTYSFTRAVHHDAQTQYRSNRIESDGVRDDGESFREVFAKVRRKKSISLIVGALWRVQEVESYALSKFQPPTTLGDHQNVEKTIRKKIDFFGFRKLVFRHFSWILEGIDNFRRQNQSPREIFLQIHLF